jgi:hypothetical protein
LEEDRLRARLARELKTNEVHDALWTTLEEEWLVRDALLGGEEEFRDLVRVAKSRLKLVRLTSDRPSPIGRTIRAELPPTLRAAEDARMKVLSDHLARLAAGTGRVSRFRREVLDGRLLTPLEARSFLSSPATRFFSRGDLQSRGVRLLDHRAVIRREDRRTDGDLVHQEVTVFIRPPGVSFEGQNAIRLVQPGVSGELRLDVLSYPGERGKAEVVPVWSGSVLDELRELGAWLAAYYDWQEAQAVWFVLTNAVPLVSPLRQEVRLAFRGWGTSARITLSIAPWVPAKTVLKAYRAVQRQMLGGDNRPLSQRNLAIFRFVTDRMEGGDRRTPWRTLLAEWNLAHSEWPCEDVRTFARDYGRAERALLYPSYR